MKKTNKSAIILFVLLVLVAVTAMYVANTYAKYTAEVNGTGKVSVAKWAFKGDNNISTLNVTLDGNVDATTLVNGKIAPGTSGKFEVQLVNTNSEVGVNFTVTLGSVTDKPANLKFYKDNTYTTELTPGTSTITGQLVAGDSTGVSIPVYFKWAYETDDIATNDPLDTADGELAKNLSIPVTVTGVQVQPGAAITSHVN